MTNLRKYFFLFLFVGSLTASAGAQVRFDVYSNPYSGPGISVSVGNRGYCQQPVYNTGYVVYPATRGARRNRGVVVAPYYNNGYYNNGYYNNGYYNGGYTNGCNNSGYYVNNGYYNNGYNNNGYNRGYYNNGNGRRRCR